MANIWDGDDDVVVCTRHKRFIPCRPCMCREPETWGQYNSSDPKDIETVREYQQGD